MMNARVLLARGQKCLQRPTLSSTSFMTKSVLPHRAVKYSTEQSTTLYDDWRKMAAKELKGTDIDTLIWKTGEV